MASLQARLAFIAAESAKLVAELHELKQLREQVRIAELQKSQHQTVVMRGLNQIWLQTDLKSFDLSDYRA